MPIKGASQVKAKIKASFEDARGEKTYKAIYAILWQGSQLSLTITPVDTSFLVNSLYKPQVNGTIGQVGYMASYARFVHAMKGKLRGQPRADFGRTGNSSAAGPQKPRAFGGGTGQGNYWDPNGQPQFLTVAFEQIKPYIPAILKEVYGV